MDIKYGSGLKPFRPKAKRLVSSLGGLSDKELISLCQSYNIEINGIFSKDDLPNELKNGWYIVNLQSSNEGSGTHWLGFKKRENKIDFWFDSMGFVAPANIEKITKEYLYGSRKLQDDDAKSCGWWVLGCILETEKDENDEFNFKSFLNSFGNNTAVNENKLNVLFRFWSEKKTS